MAQGQVSVRTFRSPAKETDNEDSAAVIPFGSDALVLGGQKVELTYVGLGHSDNMIVMNFPAERTLYACDFITVKRVGFKTLSDSYFPCQVARVSKSIPSTILIASIQSGK